MIYRPKRAPFAVRLSFSASVMALGLSALPVAAPLAAQTVAQQYEIPAGPLSAVLARFASEAGVYLVGLSEMTEGRSSQGLRGRYEVDAGFAMLLSGTGLMVEPSGANQYRLRTVDSAAMELGATNVNAALGASVEPTTSYTTRAITLGKGEHSIKEIPQSVTVITRKRMDDQNLNTIEQVMDQTPGVTVSGSPMGGKYFFSRGFKMDAPYQYDGVPLDVGANFVQANSFSSDMAFYEQVEVLRGAAGMMQGAGTPAGAVNLVRKRGQATPTTNLTLSGGTWDNYRGQIDVGGPLNEAGTLRGRMVIGEQDRHFYYDHGKREDQVAYGALDYDFSDDTTAGIGLAYEKLRATPCFGGLPSYSDGSDLKLKRSTCLGASWNHWASERTTVFADVKHRLNDDWTTRIAGAYTHNQQDMKYVQGVGVGLVDPGATSSSIRAIAGLFDYDAVDYGFDAYLDGKFRAWGLEHQLTVGANTSYSHSHDLWALAFMEQRSDVFNPTHFIEPSDSYIIDNSYRGGWPYPTKTTVKQQGAYANLRLKLAEPLTVVLGGRVSDWHYTNDNMDWGGELAVDNRRETGQFTPFTAVLFDLTPNLTVYTSYADVFQPQAYIDADGKALAPKTGKNYELGIKGEWYDGALNGSLNLFRTYQEHAAVAVDDLAICASCAVDSGKIRAQGVEMELTGSPIERLQISAGYTYTATKTLSPVSSSNAAVADGDTYNSLIPRHSLRLWSDYQLADAWSRWTLGGGVSAQSDISRISGTVKTEQPGYAIWSARVQYRLDEHWTVALNGNNLFDKVYYSTVGDRTSSNYYGDPRNYMVTLKGSF
ncbi:outer membrane receptor for ferric coprogen and ferric-rhodotorulic acid [Pseudomonas hunanensis]|uniref:Outer membrane receptor for ferric coprogen and ferric-rhodotorulic acid n=1 Tax=Pseudomonas hunanensis TaxID=1247546 RepID=A0ACC6K5E1_9PSED|nr:TonB-dependent siderophore receptor [Pseudomonas hunanensis]MDR6713685.1 outer membrane receptor for ferric coprogen and ferric-rhodotorulic acid [Pseudomonas hunanensis]